MERERNRESGSIHVRTCVYSYMHTYDLHARNSHPPTDNFRAVNDRYVFPRHPVPNRQLVVVQLCACAGVIFHILNIVV